MRSRIVRIAAMRRPCALLVRGLVFRLFVFDDAVIRVLHTWPTMNETSGEAIGLARQARSGVEHSEHYVYAPDRTPFQNGPRRIP
jgi:hypothetical protein